MKKFSYKHPEKPIYYYGTLKQVEIPKRTKPKPFLAMWVSNVLNIDLPTVEDFDLYKQKIKQMIDTAIAFNMTALFFQVRTTNDAFYLSKLNPYSRYFTGVEGKNPPFDVLSWVISEVHQQGLEFHAWCNPYRVSMSGGPLGYDYLKTCDDLNFAKRHPEHTLVDTKGQIILNPSHEACKQHIVNSMIEIVTHYQVDGIHFDDYFYPYAGLDKDHDDSNDFENREDKTQTIGDFRRFHVNDLVSRLKSELKKIRPVRFGISPFGIYKNQSSDPMGSHTASACSQSYDNQYADSLLWVQKGWVDYIVPQIYWEFGHPIAPFADICDWWQDQCSKHSVDLYIGHAAYRLGNEGEFENPDEVNDQIHYAAQYDSVKGHVFFTLKSFIHEEKCQAGIEKLKNILNQGDKKR